MRVAPTPDPNLDDIGPAMLALDSRQRRFVVGYIGDARDAGKCAEAAGYSVKSKGHVVQAHRLMHNPKVIAAIKEEAGRRLNGAAYIAVAGLTDIAADPTHKDRFKASASILDRTGFPATTTVDVKHDPPDNRSTAEVVASIIEHVRRMCPQFIIIQGGKESVDVNRLNLWLAMETSKAPMLEINPPPHLAQSDFEEKEGD